MIRARRLDCMTPLLEAVLSKVSQSDDSVPSTSPEESGIAFAEFVKPAGSPRVW